MLAAQKIKKSYRLSAKKHDFDKRSGEGATPAPLPRPCTTRAAAECPQPSRAGRSHCSLRRREAESYLGKLQGSELKGSFSLVDGGKKPKKMDAWDKDADSGVKVRVELAAWM